MKEARQIDAGNAVLLALFMIFVSFEVHSFRSCCFANQYHQFRRVISFSLPLPDDGTRPPHADSWSTGYNRALSATPATGKKR